jgi:ELWxxDGT repeat protein
MVKDLGGIPIPPGGGSVAPILMAAHNGLLYFGFDDQGGGLGNELWVSDGTTSGTKMVKDINPTAGSTPIGLTSMGKYLYFYANDGSKGYELWRSNGTDTGTSMVADIYPGPIGSYPTGYPSIFVFKNKLYFGAQGTHDEGIELYESDGTGAGTKLVKDINPIMTGSYPAFLAATSNYLFFRANDGTNGLELWITDGTSNGTKLLKDINAGATGSTPYNANVVGSKVVFSAADATHGTEPWVTDGTTAGTTLLKDIFTGKGSSYAGAPIQHNGIFYFYADDSIHGIELWQTDGTPNGTLLNTDLNKGKSGSIVGSIISNGSSLMFSCKIDKDSLGQELYTYKPVNNAGISKNQEVNNAILVYPNPVISGQKLTIDRVDDGLCLIEITSLDGKTMASFNTTDSSIMVPEHLSSGLYLMRIQNHTGVKNLKIRIE